MVDVQTISVAIASASVVAAAIYYSLQIRHQNLQIQQQNKIRQTDLLVRISPWLSISSSELQAAAVRTLNLEFTGYDDFVKKYGKIHSEKPEQTAVLAVANYLDALGILARRRLVDVDLIFEFWSGDIPDLWEKIKPLVEGMRKKSNYPILVNAEYLYNEMQKRENQVQQKGVKNG
jgi:hypothetical protein